LDYPREKERLSRVVLVVAAAADSRPSNVRKGSFATAPVAVATSARKQAVNTNNKNSIIIAMSENISLDMPVRLARKKYGY
jgi:hypothetical protein